jgi:AraC family transcriptional regulator
MDKQEMSLIVSPRGNLPEWGRRIHFDKFSIELVPPGVRHLNVRLKKTLATISFSTDQGASSLAGDGMRHYERRPYEYIVVPANFPLRSESQAAPEVLVFNFRFEDMRAVIAAATEVSPDVLEPRVIIGRPKPFITEVAQRIRRHMGAEVVSRDYLWALGFSLLVEMLRLPPRQRATGRGATLSDRVLRSILDYIDANLDANLSLEELAGLAGVMTHQFGRAFKRKVGEPPHRYVLARRVEAARSLLRATDQAIADIAFATGFSSQSHMTTTFRREIGVTPAQLRIARGE